MILKSCKSVGTIDYGNNNFFEVMVDKNHKVVLCSHDDEYPAENPDGTYDSEGLSLNEFIEEIKDRDDFMEILTELMSILS